MPQTLPTPRTLLVVRDDRLGDFFLAWPAFALLRAALPETRLLALVPEYTAAAARLCPSLDDLLVVPAPVRDRAGSDALAARLPALRCDATLSFFSHYYTARAFRRAAIPVRIAPRTKLAQFLHTETLRQRRSLSLLPEYRYNLDLAAYALRRWGRAVPPEPRPPFLVFGRRTRDERRQELRRRHAMADDTTVLAMHPGHGGSALNLDPETYAAVGAAIAARLPSVAWLVTAGPGRDERERAEDLARRFREQGVRYALHVSDRGIAEFALDLSTVEAFFAGSTGPLHLAALLGVPTVGFYPERRSASALRWRPPAAEGNHLGVTCAEDPRGDRLAPPRAPALRDILDFVARRVGGAGG